MLAFFLLLATPPPQVHEHVDVRRRLVTFRVDPKGNAGPGACDALRPDELTFRHGKIVLRPHELEPIRRPATHWLLLDLSLSTDLRQNEGKRAIREYLRTVLRPGFDRAALVSVDDDAILVEPPTDDLTRLDRAVDRLATGGASLLREALADVLLQARGSESEHVVVFWTDGGDGLSTLTIDELRAWVEQTPAVTVFPVALPDSRRGSAAAIDIGLFLEEVARTSGGRVELSADPGWIQGVRGWLDRRWQAAVPVPPGTDRGPLKIELARPACRGTVLPTPPEGPPDDVLPPLRPWWVREAGRRQEAPCDPTAPPAAAGDGLQGCALDILRDSGLLYAPGSIGGEVVTRPKLSPRPYRVEVATDGRFPTRPHEVLWSLLGRDPAPLLVNGRTLLVERGRISSGLARFRADLGDWARARATAEREADLRLLVDEAAAQAPQIARARLEAVLRETPRGRRLAERAARPGEVDLRDLLAAWLGDVPAYELFRDFERELLERRLSGDDAAVDRAREGWSALRAPFAVPRDVRIRAPLVLGRDPDTQRLGFWRVVLPRPYGFYARAEPGPERKGLPYDLVPDRPYALEVLEALIAEREVAPGWALEEMAYEDLVPPLREDAERPYRSLAIRLVLRGPDGAPRQFVRTVEVARDRQVRPTKE